MKTRDEENVPQKLTRDENFQRIALKGKKYVCQMTCSLSRTSFDYFSEQPNSSNNIFKKYRRT